MHSRFPEAGGGEQALWHWKYQCPVFCFEISYVLGQAALHVVKEVRL